MRRRLLTAAALFALILGCFGGTYLWLVKSWQSPGPLPADLTLIIPKGAGLSGIADILAANGVIARSDLFMLGLFVEGGSRNLRAGEYAFRRQISMAETVDLLRLGRVVQHRITIPEGWTVAEVIEHLRALDFLDGDGPTGLPTEGSIRPDTYFVERGADRNQLVQRMVMAQTATLGTLMATFPKNPLLPDAHSIVVLASIVERETSIEAERPRVARVFLNRLQSKMRLQSDPTVIYGLSGQRSSLDRMLTREDLRQPSPWNTYVIDALPASAICNPGPASIQAVLAPAEDDSLYFVADGSGGHAFARTLDEHNRNVARWRHMQPGTKPTP